MDNLSLQGIKPLNFMVWCIYSTPAERREINRFFSRGKIGGNLFF